MGKKKSEFTKSFENIFCTQIKKKKLQEFHVECFPSLRSHLAEEMDSMQSGTRPSIPAVHLIWTVQTSWPIIHGSNPLNTQWQIQGLCARQAKHWCIGNCNEATQDDTCFWVAYPTALNEKSSGGGTMAAAKRWPGEVFVLRWKLICWLHGEKKSKRRNVALSLLRTSGDRWVISPNENIRLSYQLTQWKKTKQKQRMNILASTSTPSILP